MNTSSIMKKLVIFLIIFKIGFLCMACEINFKVGEKYQKEVFAAGEEIVVELKIFLAHRECHVGIDDTKITSAGCEITGATKWTETTPDTFERKLKVKVLPGKESEMKLTCTRSCDKDGGYGKIILKKKS
jgi:hypothetical protein